MCYRLLPLFLRAGALGLLPWLLILGTVGSAPIHAQVINEFVGNHTGPDDYVYIEFHGTPSTDYSHLTLVQIEGDVGDDAGRIGSVYTVGTTDSSGLWWTGYVFDDFDNQSYTILLVEGWSGTVGTDLDATDDGSLDSTPWTSVVDSVGILESGAGNFSYLAQTDLVAGFDGNGFPPGGASRIPDGTDTGSSTDWVRNDWDGAGLPGLTGSLGTDALNTPGTPNSTTLPPAAPPILNEIVADHVGADSAEFVELFGDGDTDFSQYWVVVLDGNGTVDEVIQAGLTGPQGFWLSTLGADALLDGTSTFLLVETWTGSLGQDLDTNDDGTLDLTPWTSRVDDVAFGKGTGNVYSTVDLGDIGGASRLPNGTDTDSGGDWQENDFDGAGLSGFGGTPGSGESWNTPGSTNLNNSADYYVSVDSQDGTALRDSLHALIDDHTRFPYSSSDTDTWDILEQADEDPTNSSNVLTIYKNSTEAKFGGGNGPYNREHTWPKSLGFPDESSAGGASSPYTDCHHLRLSDVTYNSDRGSRAFGTCSAACSERVTDVNAGFGGGSGVYPGNSNWVTGPDGGSGTFEVWDHRKGDVARSIFYMDIRYEGGAHGLTGDLEPNLELTDDTGLIAGTGSNTSGTAYMGRLSVLLAWHAADPPDDDERRRNEVIFSYQGNRNPFVDFPAWVGCIYLEEGCETPLFADGFESGDTTGWSSSTP